MKEFQIIITAYPPKLKLPSMKITGILTGYKLATDISENSPSKSSLEKDEVEKEDIKAA
jgi:hypothetical protein